MDNDKQSPNRDEKQTQDHGPSGFPPGMNPENLQKEFQDLVERKFGGRVQVLSIDETLNFDETDGADGPSEDGDQNENFRLTLESFNYKPRDIKKYLDRFVIGQEQAKQALSIAVCDHYNHLRSELNSPGSRDIHYQKQNVMIMGPTGVGKTYLVRLISDLIGVPFVKADATRFSEVGYMGANVDDIIRDLVQNAGGDKNLAAKGIVYVDEVDKLASKRDHTGRDVSGRGVQFGFLRLLENSDVDLNASHDIASQFKTFMNFQKKGKAEKEIVNTRDILFIFSGAFHGLEEIINTRLDRHTIGLHETRPDEDVSVVLKDAQAKDLVEFGFEHEFIGRLPIRVACDSLSVEDLYSILKESEHSILNQFIKSFELYGISLRFTDKALQLLSAQAFEQKTGARGLTAVFEELLRPFKFELPSTNVKDVVIDENVVANPKGALHHLVNI